MSTEQTDFSARKRNKHLQATMFVTCVTSLGFVRRKVSLFFPSVCLYEPLRFQTSHFEIFVLRPQGRGSGFPGRRRPRGAGLSGRAGRGRARGKNGASPSINPGVCAVSWKTSQYLWQILPYMHSSFCFPSVTDVAAVL